MTAGMSDMFARVTVAVSNATIDEETSDWVVRAENMYHRVLVTPYTSTIGGMMSAANGETLDMYYDYGSDKVYSLLWREVR